MANDELLKLIHEHCTTEQITALLREGKGNEGVRISAENKEFLVQRNLRDALEAKAINIEHTYDLLREAEENGNHHTFYFRPKTKKLAEQLTIDYIGKALLGKAWRTNWVPNAQSQAPRLLHYGPALVSQKAQGLGPQNLRA